MCRTEGGASILVCSKGGGGLLEQRMEVVQELREANIKVKSTTGINSKRTLLHEYMTIIFCVFIRRSLCHHLIQVLKSSMSMQMSMISSA